MHPYLLRFPAVIDQGENGDCFGREHSLQFAQGFIHRIVAGLTNDSIVRHGFLLSLPAVLDVRLQISLAADNGRYQALREPVAPELRNLQQGW